MKRFFVPAEEGNREELWLPPAEAHHALTVLRVRPGEAVEVLNGAGQTLSCDVIQVGRRDVQLRVRHRRALPQPPSALTLLQAVPKPRAMDLILQKATELGARRIVPWVSERTVGQWVGPAAADKAAKWRAVAIEAAKQCGNPWLPEIEPPTALSPWLARGETFDVLLIASLQPGAVPLRAPLDRFGARHGSPPRSVLIGVGPEGDLTPGEIRALEAVGAVPVTLGPYVLRSETAALYCLSVLTDQLQGTPSSAPAPAESRGFSDA